MSKGAALTIPAWPRARPELPSRALECKTTASSGRIPSKSDDVMHEYINRSLQHDLVQRAEPKDLQNKFKNII